MDDNDRDQKDISSGDKVLLAIVLLFDGVCAWARENESMLSA